MEKIKVQINNYQPRVETHDGREHIVVPVVMMVEGVHDGSDGPLYHSAEELGRFPGSWNGIPIVINHPEDEEGGISANSPDVLEREKVGTVFGAHMDGDKLKAEAWIDVQKLAAVSPDSLQKIKSGEFMEVSIGVFNEQVETEGDWHGEHYIAVARNHRPDHLALLPDAVGACSGMDGCGLRLNKGGDMKENLIEKGFLLRPISNAGFIEIMQDVQLALNMMDTDSRAHFLEDLYEGYFIYRVDSQGEESRYFRRDYEVKEDGSVEFDGEPERVSKEVSYETFKSNINRFIDKLKGGSMSKKSCCPDKVNQLIANKATRWTEDDREALNELDEGTINKMFPVEQRVTKDQITEALSDVDAETLLSYAPEQVRKELSKGLEANKKRREDLVKGITENSDLDKEDLEGQSIEYLEKLEKSFTKGNYSGQAGGQVSVNEGEVAPMDDPWKKEEVKN